MMGMTLPPSPRCIDCDGPNAGVWMTQPTKRGPLCIDCAMAPLPERQKIRTRARLAVLALFRGRDQLDVARELDRANPGVLSVEDRMKP